MTSYPIGLLLRGIRHPEDSTSSVPVLYCTRAIGGTLPAELPAGTVVRAWLDASALGDVVQTPDIRDPVRPADALTLRLIDVDDQLSALFAEDPFGNDTTVWDVNAVRVTAAATSIRVVGPSAPTDETVYTLNGEAVKVTNVAAVSGTSNAWDLTVTRAVSGSRAVVHRLNPAEYGPGEDGTSARLTLQSRPDFEARFEATLYQFELAGDYSASTLWAHHGYIEERPRATGDGRWEVRFADLAQILEDVSLESPEVTLSHCVRVETILPPYPWTNPTAGLVPGVQDKPLTAALALDVGQAEKFLGEPLRVVGTNEIDSAQITALNTRLTQDSAVSHLCRLTAGGYEYLYKATGISTESAASQVYNLSGFTTPTLVRVDLALLKAEDGASVRDEPVSYFGNALLAGRSGYNAGWSERFGDPIREGEEAPKVKRWVRIQDTPVKAALRLLHSDDGSGATDSTYDTIFGLRCGLSTGLVNQGSASGTPLTVDEGTSALLELDEILDEKYDYVLARGTLHDWFKNLCYLHNLLWVAVPASGKVSLRRWFRSIVTSTPDLINPLVGPGNAVSPAERLDPLREVVLEFGYDPLTLDPLLPPVALKAKRARRQSSNQSITVRIWTSGAQAQSAAFATATLASLSLSLQQLRGEPVVYRVPTFLPDAVRTPGDLVRWTDTSISVPTPTGHGVTAKKHIAMGAVRELGSGRQILKLLPDAVNTVSSSAGRIAPTLRVEAVTSIADNGTVHTVTCQVTSVGEASFNITSGSQAIFNDLASSSGRVRVLRPAKHNPLGERRGWVEASAVVTAAAYSSSTGTSGITFTIDNDWERGSGSLAVTVEDLFVAGETFICLSDRRASTANPEGAEITPDAEQLSAQDDFLKFAPASGLPFDGHFSTITT